MMSARTRFYVVMFLAIPMAAGIVGATLFFILEGGHP